MSRDDAKLLREAPILFQPLEWKWEHLLDREVFLA